MNETKDIKALESMYTTLYENNEDNKVWKKGDCPEVLGDSELAHQLKPEENRPENADEDAIEPDDENELYVKKISERLEKGKKSGKNVNEQINNSRIMSNEPKNIFDKLYDTIMEGDDPFGDLDGMNDELDAGGEDTESGDSLDLGGDEVTFTLPRDIAEKLHDVLMDQLGGDDEEMDSIEDMDDEGEDSMLGDAVVSEPEPKACADGTGKMTGHDNKVALTADGGKADGGDVKEDPEPKPLADGKAKLQGKDNKVHNPKSSGLLK